MHEGPDQRLDSCGKTIMEKHGTFFLHLGSRRLSLTNTTMTNTTYLVRQIDEPIARVGLLAVSCSQEDAKQNVIDGSEKASLSREKVSPKNSSILSANDENYKNSSML